MANKKISDATNVLLEAGRSAFGEPHGDPALYRFSISGNQLECMHATRKPMEWRSWPIVIRTNTTTKMED